jgi:Carboxypeptidase regulatory-like domain
MWKTAFGMAILVVAFVSVWLKWCHPSQTIVGSGRPKGVAVFTPSTTVFDQRPSPGQYLQIDVSTMSEKEVSAEVSRRDHEDSKWEWKVPIRFFGRVVDENLSPVAGAQIHFQWTDLSSRGTSESASTSNESGSFSLSNVQGKRLLVRVNKDGYYSSGEQNRLSFEFANPYEEIYHYATPDRPVIFHLRNKGPDQTLVKKSLEIVLPANSSKGVDFGSSGSSFGHLEVEAWKPWPPKPISPHYDWKIVLKIPDGGFVETREEFTFEAPETGYSTSFEVDMPATAADWSVSTEKTLYFVCGEPKRYGRLNFRTSGNSRYIFMEYVLNPSGSRNLEYDPAKEVKGK